MSAFAALQRVRVTPLGVARGMRRRKPGWWRLLVPGAGLAGFAALAVLRSLDAIAANGTAALLLAATSLLLVLLGLVLAGPWICYAVARVLAQHARRAPALMAARRLAADPQATFRAISGVVLAAFVTTMFAGVTPNPATKPLEHDQLRPGVVEVLTEAQPEDAVTRLRARLDGLAGVKRIVTVHNGPHGTIAVSCADLAAALNLDCPPSDQPTLTGAGLPPRGLIGVTGLAPAVLSGPVRAFYVLVSGGAAGEDRVRAATAAVIPAAHTESRADQVQLDDRQLRELNNGLRAATAFVLLVPACSLTVAAVGSLIERRQPFALLRAAGMDVGGLRNIVMLETAVPLVLTVGLGALLGLVASAAISSSSGQPWQVPGTGYGLATLGGLAAALAITALMLPLVNVATRPHTIRFD